MKFLHIVPLDEAIYPIEAPTFDDAKVIAGLGNIDFGALGPDLSIAVDEYGLMDELDKGYFSIGRQLFAGNAIVFSFDSQGETQSTEPDDQAQIEGKIAFFANRGEALEAIASGYVDAPKIAVNGEVTWEFV